VNIAGYDHDEPMIYGKLAIEAHDAKIRAAALKDAAYRAVACYINLAGGRVPVDEADLRAAIYAGEVIE
jgi:hypothetical protein